jgi:dTDP-4-amino-4,6-dideoxygalactose transaminase
MEAQGLVRRPIVPPDCVHNAHMFYLLLPSLDARTQFIDRLRDAGIAAVFHYVPLHSSPAGQQFGRAAGPMVITNRASDCLVRMPLWLGLEGDLQRIFDAAEAALWQQDGQSA